MEIIIVILGLLLISAALTAIIVFFVDTNCLPQTRKMEKMLSTIKRDQDNNHIIENEILYKGKMFKVHVRLVNINYCYSYYEVSINDKLVKTFHILKHLFSKSRYDQHHGDMREREEFEIIQATYKCIQKAKKLRFEEQYEKSSYFY